MKQSEIDRELRLLAKAEARRNGWKSVGGMPYRTIGPLFFVLVLTANARRGSFFGSFRFKWLELDNVLWRVLDMSSNEDAPFSLHANGAFVLGGQEIYSVLTPELEWLPGIRAQRVEDAMSRACVLAAKVASQITSIHSYLDFIQREHEAFMQRHPKAVTNLWKETLLVAMINGDLATAAEIARTRIASGDSGGFQSGGKSFFERAQTLCKT